MILQKKAKHVVNRITNLCVVSRNILSEKCVNENLEAQIK